MFHRSVRIFLAFAAVALGATECSAGFISLTFSAANRGDGAEAFGLEVSNSLAGLNSPIIVMSTLTITLTDATGDGVSLSPVDTFISVGLLRVGSTKVDAGVGLGSSLVEGPGVAGTTYTFGPLQAGPQVGPSGGPYDGIEIRLSFLLSGNGDSANIEARFEVSQATVPEPSSIVLCGLGTIVVGGIARRGNPL